MGAAYFDIHKLCNEVRDFYKYKGIRIFYWAGFLPFLTEDGQILKQDAKEACLVIQELKRLAQELAIPIIVTYPCKGTDVINGEWGIEILNVANILLDLDKHQHNSTYSFIQTPMNVLKTNDGQLGRFFLNHYSDIISSS